MQWRTGLSCSAVHCRSDRRAKPFRSVRVGRRPITPPSLGFLTLLQDCRPVCVASRLAGWRPPNRGFPSSRPIADKTHRMRVAGSPYRSWSLLVGRCPRSCDGFLNQVGFIGSRHPDLAPDTGEHHARTAMAFALTPYLAPFAGRCLVRLREGEI